MVKKADIGVGLYLLCAVIFFIIPIPSLLLDVMLAINIGIALIILFNVLFVKEVLDITDTSDYNLSLSSPSYSYFIKQNIEIRLSVNENNTILVERSGIAVYDDLDPNSVELAEMEKKIYWYITCDGEFYKRSLAIRSNWTNILTFAPAGDYAVTLVLDNDEEIEDQAPISNTILYSKRSKNSNSEEYESVPLEKED